MADSSAAEAQQRVACPASVDLTLPAKVLNPCLDASVQGELVKGSVTLESERLKLQTEQIRQDGAIAQEKIKQQAAMLNSALTVVALLLIAILFRRVLADFFRRLSELSLKTPAGEFSAKAAEVSALVGAEVAKTAAQEVAAAGPPPVAGGPAAVPIPAPERVVPDVEAVTASARLAARAAPRLKNRTILWVDDHPENNSLLIRAFEALDIRVDTSTSTADAVQRVRVRRPDLAITDMTRGADGQAGLDFIEEARRIDPRLKIAVYASRRASEKFPRAYELGAVVATASPNELFDRVVSHLT